MKKFLTFMVLFATVMFSSSCRKDPATLVGTAWDVVFYEEQFAGSTMWSSDDVVGEVDFEYSSGEVKLVLKAPFWDDRWYTFDEDEYIIAKSSANELVIDLFWYEYDDVDKDDLDYIETFNGKKIYREYWNGDYYFYYFLPNGHAVDLGQGEDYWYDKVRLHCRRTVYD